jgi:hypothetical protein
MKRASNQRGDAHVVIMIVLIVALIGALGFVFYQNFIMKKPMTDSTTQTDSAPVETSETARFAFNDSIYAVDYPKDWSKEELATPSEQKGYTLVSPDKSIKLHFEVSSGGVGGACDPNSPLRLRFYNVSTHAVTKLGKTSAYIVEAMTDAEGGGYNYKVGLTEEGGETHATIGDSHCTVAYVGLASRMITNNQTGAIEQPTVFARAEFPKLVDSKTGKLKEMQPLKDKLAGEEYKTAAKILESVRKE